MENNMSDDFDINVKMPFLNSMKLRLFSVSNQSDDILLSNIEAALERNLLGRDEDTETIERITELFKNSERTQLKWHFKQI